MTRLVSIPTSPEQRRRDRLVSAAIELRLAAGEAAKAGDPDTLRVYDAVAEALETFAFNINGRGVAASGLLAWAGAFRAAQSKDTCGNA